MASVPAFLRDPLLERDYVRLCSRPTFFRNRAIAPALLGAILLLMFAFREEMASADEMGRSIHLVFTWLAAFLTSSTAAAETAVAIPTERSTGSLTVLLTVPRKPLRLATGFFLSRVLVAGTALLAVLPLEGIALLLGGVDLADLGTSLLCIASATIYGAAIGLYAGYDAPNHRLAVGRTAFLSFGLAVLLPAALAAAGAACIDYKAPVRPPPPNLANPYRAEDWFLLAALVTFFLSPVGALATHSFQIGRVGMPPFGPPWLTPTWIQVAVAVVAVLLAVAAILVTGMRLRADTERSTVAIHRVGPWRWFVGLFRKERPREAVDVWSAPLLWKESRPPRNPWVRWGLYLVVVGYGVFLGFLWFSVDVQGQLVGRTVRETGFFDVFCAIPAALFLLGTAAACGSLLAEERERQILDLLRVAPFSARDFFLARFLGTGWRLLPLVIATAPFVLIGTWMGIVHPLGVLLLVLGPILVSPFLALLAFRAGSAAETVRAAQRRTGMVLGVFVVGWPFLHWFLNEALRAEQQVHQAVAAINPFLSVSGPYLLFVRATYENNQDLVRFGGPATAAAVFWALAAWFLWWRLPRDLDRAFHGTGAE